MLMRQVIMPWMSTMSFWKQISSVLTLNYPHYLEITLYLLLLAAKEKQGQHVA